MNQRNPLKLYLAAALLLLATLTFASGLLPQVLALTAFSDLIGALLMLCAFFAFAANGLASTGRMRWFWMLQAAGWGHRY